MGCWRLCCTTQLRSVSGCNCPFGGGGRVSSCGVGGWRWTWTHFAPVDCGGVCSPRSSRLLAYSMYGFNHRSSLVEIPKVQKYEQDTVV